MRPFFGLSGYDISAPGGRKHRPGSGGTSNNHNGIEDYRRTPLRKETSLLNMEDRNRPFSYQNGRFLSPGEEEEVSLSKRSVTVEGKGGRRVEEEQEEEGDGGVR